MNFAHDGDLYSWIVKDIIINHHFRLIGQLTSAPGIFIGPLFYYLLVPFFLITKMDPVGAAIPITILGILTTLSYYFVFSKLFNKEVGLIASFLHACLVTLVNFDRWVVPSTPTDIWSVWFFYVTIQFVRGNFSSLPLLGVLIGLIWHIHIALALALIAIPLAIILSRKLPNKRDFFYFITSLLVTSLPLMIFEVRHHFSQTAAFLNNFTTKHSQDIGFYNFQDLIVRISSSTVDLLFWPASFSTDVKIIILLGLLTSMIVLVFKRLVSLKEMLVLYSWIAGIILFFTFSTSPISGYYYANINVIFIGIVSIVLFSIFQISKPFKALVVGLLILILIRNYYYFVNMQFYKKGYLERKRVVEYIIKNSRERKFPCVAISYLTTIGENVGFRYLFWFNNLKTAHPSLEVPTYTIVIPDELAKDDVKFRSGHIGLIPPKNIPPTQVLERTCNGPNTNLTDSLFGFTN